MQTKLIATLATLLVAAAPLAAKADGANVDEWLQPKARQTVKAKQDENRAATRAPRVYRALPSAFDAANNAQ